MNGGIKSGFGSTPYEWELIYEPSVYGKALVLTFLDIASLKLESGMKRVIGVGSLLITRHTGQENSPNLWALIGKLIWRGLGTQKNEYCVSRLMAFDAEIIGTWGCLPRHYPKVLEFVLNKAIEIKLFTELRPMSRIREVFEKAHSRKLMKRVVLTPDF